MGFQVSDFDQVSFAHSGRDVLSQRRLLALGGFGFGPLSLWFMDLESICVGSDVACRKSA